MSVGQAEAQYQQWMREAQAEVANLLVLLESSHQRVKEAVAKLRVAQNFTDHRPFCPSRVEQMEANELEGALMPPCVCGLDEIDEQIHEFLASLPVKVIR